MPGIWDSIRESEGFKTVWSGARKVYNTASSLVWPIYSTGIVTGFMFLIAAMHEKQTIADAHFGDGQLARDPEECAGLIRHASELLEEEVNQAVKADVYALSHAELKAEYAAKQQF